MFSFLNGTISNQIYFVYGLIGIVLILIVAILLMDRKERKKGYSKNLFDNKFIRKQGIEPHASEVELKPVEKKVERVIPELLEPVEENIDEEKIVEEKVDEGKNEYQVPSPSFVETKKEMVNPMPSYEAVRSSMKPIQKEETITYVDEDPELEKTQAQLELQRLTEELKKAETEENDRIKLTNFELEQEENAIISIHELMKRSNELYDKNEEIQYMDEGNEPINLEELQKRFAEKEKVETIAPIKEQVEVKPVSTEQIVSPEPIQKTESKETGKFKSSPFISPVFGLEKQTSIRPTIQKKEVVTPIVHEDSLELEQTADLEQLDEEIRKTNEFLQVLKELQKNLE